MKTPRLPVLLAMLLVLLVPSLLSGHAVVYPRAATTGAFERYVLRVPNEKDVATTRVEIRFPEDLRVTSFAEVNGWQLEILTDSAKRVIGAVWTGTLPPKRFVEFPFVAANPKTAGSLTWPAFQTYANGERIEWAGAPGTKAPASVTKITMPDSTVVAAKSSGAPQWVPWAALVLSLAALGLSLRRSS
jgi:uncharacterized protein YcnI